MSYCKHRILDNCKKDGRPCIFSYECFEPEEQPPQTNADHIRSMTDEELAKLFIDSPCHGMSCADAPHSEFGSAMCVECQLKWLRQPYKEGKEDGK